MGDSDLKRYTVRLNCEYSTEVSAVNEDSAEALAMDMDVAEWDQAAWSTPEVEED